MPDLYTPYHDIDSDRAASHTEGRLHLQGGASGFSYRKDLITALPVLPAIVKDDWKVQIVQGDGGLVLFEQTVNYVLDVVALPPVFIAFPASDEDPNSPDWKNPTNPGGHVQILTTVINGQPIDPR